MPDLTDLKRRMLEEVERCRPSRDDVYASAADMERIVNVLQVMLCNHEFESRRAGGDPADAGSDEVVAVCKHCGAEV